MKETREIIPSRPVDRRGALERPGDLQTQDNGTYTYRPQVIEQGSFQIYEYWRAIRKRLWLVVGIAVLVTTLAALYMSRKPNVYRAMATVQVDLEQANPDLVSSESRRPVTGDPAYFNTQLQLLTSDSLLRRTVKDMDLEHNVEFVKTVNEDSVSTTQSILRGLGLANKETAARQVKEYKDLEPTQTGELKTVEDMKEALRVLPFVENLRRGINIEPVRESRSTLKETRLIEISYQHTNPALAATVVNGIADTFTRQNQEKRSRSSSDTSSFLEEQIASYQTKIKEDEENKARLERDVGILSTGEDPSQTIVMERLSLLNKQLTEAENNRQKAEAAYRAAIKNQDTLNALADKETAPATTVRDSVVRTVESNLRAKIDETIADRQKLLVEYTPEAPEVQELDKKINSLQEAIKTNRENAKQDLESVRKHGRDMVSNVFLVDFEKAKGQEIKVRSEYNNQYNAAQGQNSAAINIKILGERIVTNKDFLESLLKQQRETNVVAAGTDNNISVVDHALPSEVPVSPRRLMTVAVSFILATLFGAGLALFLEYLDDTIRSTEEVEKYLQLPALAAIPTIDALAKKRLLLVGNNIGEETNSNTTSELLIHSDSRSSLSEAYRQLRTSILLSTAGHAPKSLLVTSSLPSEGKTTTAVNTAISLAQTGASVLIIDADMRRPRLHNIFGIGNAEGLSSVLSSGMPEEDVLSIISYDEATKLNVLPSGPIPPNPAELIGSDQMRILLKGMENHFTHVVVDSPPIASFTDGVLIGSVVDGVLLVVHSGKSSRQVVKRAKQFLNEVGAKIFGVVLNNANLRANDDYYYYQSYYYRGGYYRQDEEEK
jgi:succinoglycan biosynthesis transport protein ExoP